MVPGRTFANVAPPSLDAHTPRAGVPGGLAAVWFDASPCVPERVPIRMWFALPGSIAIHVIERLLAAAVEPGTRLQFLPSLVDLKRPRPASLSPLPFPSPVPT